MKKTLFFLAMLTFGIISAQEETKENKKVAVDFYIGIGLQAHDEYNLNKRLMNANVAEIETVMPELSFGLNFFGEKYSGDAEFGFLFSKNSFENTKNQYVGFTSRVRVHYNLVNKEKVAFTTGLSLSSTSSDLSIYSRNNVIDFNDLNPANNGGQIRIRNQVFYAGPSVSVYLFKNKKVRLNAGYEFAFTNGRWKSDYASTQNRVKENGNNRFVFGISLL